MEATKIHEEVSKRYGSIAEKSSSCCGPKVSVGCCGSTVPRSISSGVGYGEEDMDAVPENANLGLGCGNPVALSSIKEGDTVLDLGSGGGFDCFLAANRVGDSGQVIGVDMTDEMLALANKNKAQGGYKNVEFRKGHIEQLPVEDGTVDVVISNCVINLSPDQPQVFREIARVLKPGGKMFVSDVVLRKPLPKFLMRSMALHSACIGGAKCYDEYLGMATDAGLGEVEVLSESSFSMDYLENDPAARPWVRIGKWIPGVRGIIESIVSIKLGATKV